MHDVGDGGATPGLNLPQPSITSLSLCPSLSPSLSVSLSISPCLFLAVSLSLSLYLHSSHFLLSLLSRLLTPRVGCPQRSVTLLSKANRSPLCLPRLLWERLIFSQTSWASFCGTAWPLTSCGPFDPATTIESHSAKPSFQIDFSTVFLL